MGEDLGTAVGQVVPVHAGDDDVPELHLGHRLGEADRLLPIERTRRPMGHGAVRAVPGAHVPQDHERRRFVLPALADVGAVGFLAHRMELQAPHHLLEGHVIGAARGLDLEPGGLAL